MEEKLMNEFESFCRFNCKYKKGEEINEKIEVDLSEICDKCGNLVILDDTTFVDLIPCNYCQIEEFIREIRDRI